MNKMVKFNTIGIALGVGIFSYQLYKIKVQQKKHKSVLVGTIELGGTFCTIAIMEKQYTLKNKKFQLMKVELRDKIKIDTVSPEETLHQIVLFLRKHPIEEIGIASFGPLDLNQKSASYGNILMTPKKLWINFPILKTLQLLFKDVHKFSIDTDVNVCAQAEYLRGGHEVCNSLAYITVGTGVGVGLVINGKPVHGLLHPEGGHSLIPALNQPGNCEFHDNCVEGYCSNNAIAKRLNCKIEDLHLIPDTHEVWQQVSDCLAALCLNICLIASPEVIILGGGVMNRIILYDLIQEKFKILLNGYLKAEALEVPQFYIRKPGLGIDVGLIGAAILSDELI